MRWEVTERSSGHGSSWAAAGGPSSQLVDLLGKNVPGRAQLRHRCTVGVRPVSGGTSEMADAE